MANPIQGLYGTTDFLHRSLDAALKRSEVITHNIANVDTPGYQRQDVAFEAYLNQYMRPGKIQSERTVGLTEPAVYTDHQTKAYRLDGNQVDIDAEMAYLAQNQIRYDTLTAQVNYQFNNLKTVMR